MNFIAILFSLAVGIFILIGTVISIKYGHNSKFTDISICIAFGVIIGLVIFELLPETYEVLNGQLGSIRSILAIIILILIGITILKILDLFVPHHEHEVHHTHKHNVSTCHNIHLHHIGIISSVALIIHNVIEGMSLYLVTSSNINLGFLLFIGIGLHNLPMGLVIGTTLIASNYSNKKTLKLSLIVSLSTFIGGISMFILEGVSELLEGILLGLTLGMLIYISLFELLHQIYHMKDRKSVSIGIGIGVIILAISVIIGKVMH